MKRVVAAVYLLAGLVSAFVCFQSLMWAVWGAPTHWTQYVGLISSLIATGGACGLLISGERGQGTCAAGVIGMGLFYIPATQSIIPAENLIISPLNCLILAGYLAFISFVMVYPKRIKGAGIVIGLAMLAMSGWAAITAHTRWKNGEFNRPQIVGFLASRSAEPLGIPQKYETLVPAPVRDGLSKEGIGGRLEWHGSSGDESKATKVVVIATSRIPAPKVLPYPKQGIVIYSWNGNRWIVFPKDADCYPAFATLQMNGMISNELANGGVQSVYFYPWQNP